MKSGILQIILSALNWYHDYDFDYCNHQIGPTLGESVYCVWTNMIIFPLYSPLNHQIGPSLGGMDREDSAPVLTAEEEECLRCHNLYFKKVFTNIHTNTEQYTKKIVFWGAVNHSYLWFYWSPNKFLKKLASRELRTLRIFLSSKCELLVTAKI